MIVDCTRKPTWPGLACLIQARRGLAKRVQAWPSQSLHGKAKPGPSHAWPSQAKPSQAKGRALDVLFHLFVRSAPSSQSKQVAISRRTKLCAHLPVNQVAWLDVLYTVKPPGGNRRPQDSREIYQKILSSEAKHVKKSLRQMR